MAQDTNVVVLVGRLAASMEVRHTQSAYPIGSFTIAVNRSKKSASGTWEDKASFFDCDLYGNIVTGLQEYLVKGKQVSVTGFLEQDRWEKEGQRFSRVKVVVRNIQLVGSKGQKSGGSIAPESDEVPF